MQVNDMKEQLDRIEAKLDENRTMLAILLEALSEDEEEQQVDLDGNLIERDGAADGQSLG